MPQVSFKRTKAETKTIQIIAKRASILAGLHGNKVPPLHFDMDVTACHANDCRLDLERLLAADDFNFMHDVFGIDRHLNRATGQLENCFLPRFASKQAA